jgi:hypothetical protein
MCACCSQALARHVLRQRLCCVYCLCRNALYRLGGGPLHNDFRPFLLPDYLHPNDLGHQIMADMVIWLLLQTAVGFADWPLQVSGPATATGALGKQPSTGRLLHKQQPVLLPRPMYPGKHSTLYADECMECSSVPCTAGTHACSQLACSAVCMSGPGNSSDRTVCRGGHKCCIAHRVACWRVSCSMQAITMGAIGCATCSKTSAPPSPAP